MPMKVAFMIFIAALALPAQAYIGPGMGAGMIATILGILGAIFLAVFGVLYYPIKRMIKKNKAKKEQLDKNS
jgi:flagellar motor component MotA